MDEGNDCLREALARLGDAPPWGRFEVSLSCGESAARVAVILDGGRPRLEAASGEAPCRAALRLDACDLDRYLSGEAILLDLISRGRLVIRGSTPAGLELLALLKTGQPAASRRLAWQILGQDALSPYPGATAERDFEVQRAEPGRPATIPIVINNFNRLAPLRALVDFLLRAGCENFYVIDNDSSYGPLLEYYQTTGLRVFRLNRNVGAFALWRTAIQDEFLGDYYVYTDADIVPVDECPRDFLARFRDLLERHPSWDKVGFGLKIDDLPDCYALKQQVLQHESRFWSNRVGEQLWAAPIDTTFALYRRGARGGTLLTAVRTGAPCLARHLPWYADSAAPSDEDRYYLGSISGYAHWSNRIRT